MTSRLRTLARKFSNIDFFSENFTIQRWVVSGVRNVKTNGGHRLRFGENMHGRKLNLSKSSFFSEEGHSGCKSQNIAIRGLIENGVCQMRFKWTY